MIKWFNNRHNIIKYLICISLLLLSIFLIKKVFLYDYDYKYNREKNDEVEKRLISTESNKYKIYVNYPKFHNSKIDKIISNYIYDYINDFEKNAKKLEYVSTLTINYEFSFIEDYLNIYFTINNSLNSKDKRKNIIINTENYKISKISNLYDKETLTNKINSLVKAKYSSYIYNIISNEDINKFIYNINDDTISVFFDNYDYTNINYIPYITFSLTDETFNEEYNIDYSKKLIALTFDDGPSEYTSEFVDLLRLNNSKATFFMIGNRMKYNQGVVELVYQSGNEIGSHTYSHKNLTKISKDQAMEEINSVTILYNQITNDNIKYLRPPYGSINSKVKSYVPYPLIEWSIDPYDWLYRNPEKIADHIINNAYDGAIVLMHDVYPETLEAAKIIIPELKAMGYELITISDLAKHKNYELSVGKVTREIK